MNSFQIFCTLEPPTFQHIASKAAALRMRVHKDIGKSATAGFYAHSESWIATLTTGPHELVATEANGPKGFIRSCGISAPDPNGDTFTQTVIATMKLKQPSTEQTIGALHTTIWNYQFGPGTKLRLVTAAQGQPGAMLFFDADGPTKP